MKLDNYPLARILVPFTFGISAGYFFCKNHIQVSPYLWVALCSLAGGLQLFYPRIKRYSRRWIPGILFSLLFFSFGGFITQKHYQKALFTWPDSPRYYEAVIHSTPRIHARTVSYEVYIKGYRTITKKEKVTFHSINKYILLYLPQSEAALELNNGEIIHFYSTIKPPQNNGNPEEFDYRSFLIRKGISGSAYANRWKSTHLHSTSNRILVYAESIRFNLLSIYQKAGIHGEDYGTLAALTLGYKENLSEETRQQFSQAGISHVLALSGLHIGIIYVLIELILNSILRNKYRIVKQIIIIVFLWVFAFITGMLPPVIRATMMCSLMAIARLRSREALSFNTLSAAALLMLTFRPLWLFEASFQLSFVAVAGILLWQRNLYQLMNCKHRIIRYIWSILCVSTSAQIAVLPLVLYYFSSFPCYFLLTNVAVLGLITCIIYSGIFVFVLSPFPDLQWGWGKIIQFEFQLLQGIVQWIGALPGSQITDFFLSGWEAGCLTLLLFAGMEYLIYKRRNPSLLLISLFSGCLMTGSQLLRNQQNKIFFPSIVFYNQYNCPAVHLISDRHQSYLWTDSAQNTYPALLRNTSSFRNKLDLNTPQLLPHTLKKTYRSTSVLHADTLGITRFYNQTICLVNHNRWEKITAKHPLTIDYLWICKGFEGTIGSLQSLFHFKEVILDASLPERIQIKLETECIRLQIPYKRIAVHGAYVLSIT